MRLYRCLPALALLLFLPARADDGSAAKAPAQTDVKKSREQTSCCAGEEKVKCPRAKAAASSKKPATKTAAAAATAKPAAAGEANMVVTRDAETGELRPATSQEADRLLGPRPLARPEPVVEVLPDGTRRINLDERHAHWVVVGRNPDGTLNGTCATAAKAAPPAVTPTEK